MKAKLSASELMLIIDTLVGSLSIVGSSLFSFSKEDRTKVKEHLEKILNEMSVKISSE